MERATTTRWLLALNLLVIVALVAAVVSVLDVGAAPPTIDADSLGEAESPSGGGGVELEGDVFSAEIKMLRGSDFTMLDDASGSLTYAGLGCVHSAGAGTLHAIVDLPDDADVSSITVYVDDTDAGSNLSASSNYTDPAGGPPGFTTWFGVASTSDDVGDQSLSLPAPTTAGDEVIDKTTRSYEIRVSGTDSNELLCGASIIWFPESSTQTTFHPVEPCAIVDTRAGKGGREAPLTAGETYVFDAVLSDYSSQGGVATTCGLPDEIGGIFDSGEGTVAVELNLVALNAVGSGNLKIWDDDDGEPDGGALVYTPGVNTNVVLPIGVADDGIFADGGFVNVKNNGSSTVDVRVVVVGYYTRPLVNQE